MLPFPSPFSLCSPSPPVSSPYPLFSSRSCSLAPFFFFLLSLPPHIALLGLSLLPLSLPLPLSPCPCVDLYPLSPQYLPHLTSVLSAISLHLASSPVLLSSSPPVLSPLHSPLSAKRVIVKQGQTMASSPRRASVMKAPQCSPSAGWCTLIGHECRS